MTALLLSILLPLAASPAAAQHALTTLEEFAERDSITDDMASERKGHRTAIARLNEKKAKLKGLANEAARAAIDLQIEALESHHASLMNDLLTRTMRLYRIEPRPPHGAVVVPGPFRGERVTWTPIYAARQTSRLVQRPDGTVMRLTADGPYEAIIWADGRVELTEDAFRNPRYLAALLLHEAVHFEQYVTPGRGDRNGAVRLELEAHSRSSGQNTARILGLSSDDVDRIHDIHTEQMRAFQRNPGQAMMWLQFAGAGEAQDDSLRNFEGSIREAASLLQPLRPAGPAASPASSIFPGARAQPALPQPLSAPRAASEEVRILLAAACRGDWASAATALSEYQRLGPDLSLLGNLAQTENDPCRGSLLARLIIMKRANEPLDMARLQTEARAALAQPAFDSSPSPATEVPERERGPIAPGDRPTQRQAERILRGGNRFP